MSDPRVALGLALATVAYDRTLQVATVMLPEYNTHAAMVGLVHAAVRCEVESRKPGHSATEYRKNLHAMLDSVLDYEERRHKLATA